MQDHSVTSDIVFHGIPDMTQTPLRTLVLCIAANRLAEPAQASPLSAAVDAGPDANEGAAREISRLLTSPRNEHGYIEGLQHMGAAFVQAYKLDTPPPESLSQSQWNRSLRDQGERLRAASLTLGAGREEIAIEQLSVVSEFIDKHFADLPA